MAALKDRYQQPQQPTLDEPDPVELKKAGLALMENPQDAGLFAAYQDLLERKADGAHGYNDLAIAMSRMGRLDRAEACFGRAIALMPDNACFHNNMGRVLRDQGRTREALPRYREALRLQPDYANAHWNLALALLALGNYREAWAHFDWRTRADLPAILDSQRAAPPTWQGELFAGKRLLIRHEQGLGDSIQLMRYLPLVKARGGTVVVETVPALDRLYRSLAGADELAYAAPDGHPTVDFDLAAFAFDLPRIFNSDLDTLPQTCPYLAAPASLHRTWRGRLEGEGRKVGLVWAGSAKHSNDANRSCHFAHFNTLSQQQAVSFYSLQKGPAQADLQRFPGHAIRDLGPDLGDFADTAAVIEHLDLVVSVDTAVLHLAGALGKTAWGLLPYVPDWRWLLDRNDSPWYPSIRLFRQAAPGDWNGLMTAVREALTAWAKPR